MKAIIIWRSLTTGDVLVTGGTMCVFSEHICIRFTVDLISIVDWYANGLKSRISMNQVEPGVK